MSEVQAYFSGYAALFNTPDLGRDVFIPGSFSKWIRCNSAVSTPLYFQHEPDKVIGKLSDIYEDEYGLKVTGFLRNPDPEEAGNVASAIAVAAINHYIKLGVHDGLSVGFNAVKSERYKLFSDGLMYRKISEANLCEVSVVLFPMHTNARILNIS